MAINSLERTSRRSGASRHTTQLPHSTLGLAHSTSSHAFRTDSVLIQGVCWLAIICNSPCSLTGLHSCANLSDTTHFCRHPTHLHHLDNIERLRRPDGYPTIQEAYAIGRPLPRWYVYSFGSYRCVTSLTGTIYFLYVLRQFARPQNPEGTHRVVSCGHYLASFSS